MGKSIVTLYNQDAVLLKKAIVIEGGRERDRKRKKPRGNSDKDKRNVHG